MNQLNQETLEPITAVTCPFTRTECSLHSNADDCSYLADVEANPIEAALPRDTQLPAQCAGELALAGIVAELS